MCIYDLPKNCFCKYHLSGLTFLFIWFLFVMYKSPLAVFVNDKFSESYKQISRDALIYNIAISDSLQIIRIYVHMVMLLFMDICVVLCFFSETSKLIRKKKPSDIKCFICVCRASNILHCESRWIRSQRSNVLAYNDRTCLVHTD